VVSHYLPRQMKRFNNMEIALCGSAPAYRTSRDFGKCDYHRRTAWSSGSLYRKCKRDVEGIGGLGKIDWDFSEPLGHLFQSAAILIGQIPSRIFD